MSKRPPSWFDYTKHPDYLDAIDKMADEAEKNPPVWPHSAPEFGDPPPGVNFLSLGHGDCLEGLYEFDDNCVAAVITDPPYGISYDGNAWDAEIPGVRLWREVLRVLRPGGLVLAASHARTYHQLATMLELAGFEVLDMLVWSYGNSRPVGADLGNGWRSLLKRGHEPWAIVRKPLAERQVPGKKTDSMQKAPPTVADTFQRFGTAGFLVVNNGQDGQAWASNVLRVEKDRRERSLGLPPDGSIKNDHPTLKPIGLMRRLVRLVAKPGDIILDPFAGSGTTGIACMAEGVNFVGFELDPQYFDMMQNRVAWAFNNPKEVPPRA